MAYKSLADINVYHIYRALDNADNICQRLVGHGSLVQRGGIDGGSVDLLHCLLIGVHIQSLTGGRARHETAGAVGSRIVPVGIAPANGEH